MINEKKSLKSFALNKQVISKLQQVQIVGGGSIEDDLKRTMGIVCKNIPTPTVTPACRGHITSYGCRTNTTNRTVA